MLKQLMDRVVTVPLVGVDLGSAVIKVVEVKRLNGQVQLSRCATASVEGQEPATVLKLLCEKANLTTSQAALGLAAPEVIVRQFQFPHMPRKELSSAITLEAEQAILNGHALGQMATDWQVFHASRQDAVRGLIAVVPKEELSARLKIAKTAEMKPVVVDVEGLALWNAYWVLKGAHEPTPSTVLLVNVGARTTNLVIAKGPDELILVRDLHLGAQALRGGQGNEWAAEERDSLGYARSKGGLRTLDSAYLTGGGSSPDVMTLLGSAVTAPVECWNPLHQLVRQPDGPRVEESVGPLLAIAIGLALRQPS